MYVSKAENLLRVVTLSNDYTNIIFIFSKAVKEQVLWDLIVKQFLMLFIKCYVRRNLLAEQLGAETTARGWRVENLFENWITKSVP